MEDDEEGNSKLTQDNSKNKIDYCICGSFGEYIDLEVEIVKEISGNEEPDNDFMMDWSKNYAHKFAQTHPYWSEDGSLITEKYTLRINSLEGIVTLQNGVPEKRVKIHAGGKEQIESLVDRMLSHPSFMDRCYDDYAGETISYEELKKAA